MKIYCITLLLLIFVSCTKNNKDDQELNLDNFSESKLDHKKSNLKGDTEKSEQANIKTAHGNIIIKFYPSKAPKTVTRITQLIRDGFYNGLVFHRVVPNFVVQTGDPTGTGYGGSGKKLMSEFNDLKHVKGTVAMARAQDPDSADSQFYITLETRPDLDNKYTIFGKVVSGEEILDKIVQGDKIISITLSKTK